MIISRIAPMRSASKNMCSVRDRPIPSAPKLRAARASAGVSALARTRNLRSASAQPIKVAKSPDSRGSIVGTSPRMTSPVEPLIVIRSPARTRWLPTAIVPAA